MMNSGIMKELTGRSGETSNGNPKKSGPKLEMSSSGGSGIFFKGPLMACIVAAVAVFVLVQNANKHGFRRDFEVLSRKMSDAFFYETHMKVHAAFDASVVAASIASSKMWRRKGGTNSQSLELFQEKTAAMRQFAQIDSFTWHSLESSQELKKEKRSNVADSGALTCETERTCKGGKVRGEAVHIVEESKAAVTSEVFVRAMENLHDIKSTLFYPVISNEEQVMGVVAADFKWSEYFSPTTFQPETEGLVIEVENTCGQSYTFRVKNGEMVFVGEGYVHEDSLSDMTVVSDYADFVKPGSIKIINSKRPGTEDWLCGCEYRLKVSPSKEMRDLYTSSWPKMFVMGSTLSFLVLFLSFLAYDIYVTRRYSHVSVHLDKYNSIIGSLFPDVVLDRVVDESIGLSKSKVSNIDTYDTSDLVLSNRFLAEYQVPMDSAGTISAMPIYNQFPATTVLFMDVAGFTAWSSERDPEQVFMLLENVYQRFDAIASRLNVFKIETIGDCYVAVTGVPEPQKDHCLVMCRFAYECMVSFIHLTKSLELNLGPGTSDLALRVGIHSGPAIAGVLRAEKVRFQLFGDTMNTASRMESTGHAGKIQLSQDSAILMQAAGKGEWLEERSDIVAVKGKGFMKTYWVKISKDGTKLTKSSLKSGIWGDEPIPESKEESDASTLERLVEWNTEVLLELLRKVVARRKALERRHRKWNQPIVQKSRNQDSNTVEYSKYVASRSLIEHVADAIPFAPYEEELEDECTTKVALSPEVEAQVKAYVAECASLYNDVSFHNFEHASHVVMSANKLLGRIISPDRGGFQKMERNSMGGIKRSREFHDKTYGISCDPLMHFSMVQAALIHDLGHVGITNKQLCKNNKELSARYNGQSVAEQHSVNLAMHVFADPKYADLRDALLANDPAETRRYYQFLISSVLATDIADKDLKEVRQKRWDAAFEDELAAKQDKERLCLDSFYLGELKKVDFHFRVLAALSFITWAALVGISYWACPEENIEVLTGMEQKSVFVAFALFVFTFLYKVGPHLVKQLNFDAEPLSGVVIGVITIQFIAIVTDGLMALGFPTPVMIDPVMGTRVHMLRWCEWTPLAFYIYFITDGVDVPEKEVGLKTKYFFALCQGVSTFAGFLFPFAQNTIIWCILMFFSVVLFLFLYVHLAYKRKVFAKLERGVSADDKEIYDRSYHALSFLESVGLTWGILVFMFFLEGFGPMISTMFDFTRAEGFGMLWCSIFDCCSKMNYMHRIMDIHTLVFDTRARAERQKAESIRLKEESNKKATVLFEYIIQASDVAHTMQHWQIYQNWNRKLFEEMFQAYLKGESDEDPRPGWFGGEIWFFDNYIIPLAQKLVDSGVFGASGCEYLRSAIENRNEWKIKGKEITEEMIAECEAKFCGAAVSSTPITSKGTKKDEKGSADSSCGLTLSESGSDDSSSYGGDQPTAMTAGTMTNMFCPTGTTYSSSKSKTSSKRR